MQTFQKPAPGSGKRERYERRMTERAGERRALREAKLEAVATERMRREACYIRDKGCCRACGRDLFLIGGPPTTLAHCHHLQYKSAGGSDELVNRCILCPLCHDAEHASLLSIEGDPSDTLTFTKRDKKGQVVKVWQSTI